MPFTFDDFVHVNVPKLGTRENFSSEIATLSPMGVEEVRSMFPEVELTDSESVVYFPLKMCHSLPTVNKRGRCFTAKTLANSFKSAIDCVVDREHALQANDGLSPSGGDQIIGHIKASRFGASVLSPEEVASVAAIPSSPIPLYALAALYLRAAGVTTMVNEHINGTTKWQTSMECGHSWGDACLLHRGEMIPIKEAPGQMLEGIRSSSIRSYQGSDVAAVLGGENGQVDFWGLAFTTSPADEGGELLGIVGGLSRDLASKEIFHVPLHSFGLSGKQCSLELASKAVDTRITELASIAVIGETEESGEPAHTHLILSDLTILPTGIHDHWLDSKDISRGTKPKLTGRTGVHYQGTIDAMGVQQSIPHLHLIDLALTGRYGASSVSTGKSNGNAVSSEVSNEGVQNMLEDTLKRLGKLEVASRELKGEGINKVGEVFSSELAAVIKEIGEVASQESRDKATEKAVKVRIDAGELLTKEVAEAAVAEAVEAKDKEHEAEKALNAKRQERLQLVTEAGINMDFELVPADGDTQAITIGKQLEGLAVDEAGDRDFTVNFNTWKQLFESAKKERELVAGEQEQDSQAKEAASKKAAEKAAKEAANKPKQSIIAAVGGSASESSSGQLTGEIASKSPNLVGKGVFKAT